MVVVLAVAGLVVVVAVEFVLVVVVVVELDAIDGPLVLASIRLLTRVISVSTAMAS